MTVIHYPAADRGQADHGWLKSFHTFSFSSYYNPDRMHFGALRVVNDDTVTGGAGFGTHPHNDMEIISIPLEGTIVHRDSMGNERSLHAGDVQIMSAGTGITHSEFNGSATDTLRFLQIWVIPDARGVAPRYDEVTLTAEATANRLDAIIGPQGGGARLWMHQDAWLSMGTLDAGTTVPYGVHGTGRGVFVMVIDGEATVGGVRLQRRDAVGISEADAVDITADTAARILVIEVPLS